MTNSLCTHFLGMSPIDATIACGNPDDIIEAMHKAYGFDWAWETSDIIYYNDNTMVSLFVHVYTPGRVFTGNFCDSTKNIVSISKKAIFNAVLPLIKGQQSVQPIQQTQQNNNPISNNMTADQISNMIDGQQQETSEFMEWDKMTEQDFKEQEEMMFGKPQQQEPPVIQQHQQQNVPSDWDVPKEKGMTDHQIYDLKKWMKDFDITNNDILNNYLDTFSKSTNIIVRTWNDINGSNIQALINWFESLKNQAC